MTIAEDQTELKLHEAFMNVKQVLIFSNDLEQMFYESIYNLKRLVPFDIASIAVVSEDGNSFDVYTVDGNKSKETVHYEIPFDETILTKVYKSGKSISRCDIKSEKNGYKHDRMLIKDKIRCELAVPICHEDKEIGILDFGLKAVSGYTSDHERILQAAAGMFALPLERILLIDKLQNLKDESGFYNDLMAHDQNNINQGLMGYFELLMMQPELSDKQRQYLSEALRLIQSSIGLISNVRALTQLKTGEQKLSPVYVYPLYLDAVNTLQRQFLNKKFHIKHNLESFKPKIIANEMIKDIFINILGNSILFNRKEPVKISVSALTMKERGRKYVKFAIIDHGPGIEDEQKKIIFEKFSSYKSHTAQGSGLGLTLVREIIREYDGKIWVENRVKGDYSKGSKFIFLIPVE